MAGGGGMAVAVAAGVVGVPNSAVGVPSEASGVAVGPAGVEEIAGSAEAAGVGSAVPPPAGVSGTGIGVDIGGVRGGGSVVWACVGSRDEACASAQGWREKISPARNAKRAGRAEERMRVMLAPC